MLASGTVSTVAAGYVPAMMFVGLFLLGLGWSVCLIAGTTLLTGSVPAESRVEAQGTGDLTLSLCGAVAGLRLGLREAVAGLPPARPRRHGDHGRVARGDVDVGRSPSSNSARREPEIGE